MEPNALLNSLMDEAGMSHAGLAARINSTRDPGGRITRYDHTSVGRWLKGQRPRGRVPEIICRVLGQELERTISLGDIGMSSADAGSVVMFTEFMTHTTATWRSDQEHTGIADAPVITGLRAIAPVWDWENPPEDLDVSRPEGPRVSAHDVAVLLSARSRYESMYRQVGGVATLPRLVRFLAEHTTPLLRGSYNDQTGRDLLRAAGGLTAVTGICAYDTDAQGLAQRYFHQALRLAKASGDRAFGGYVIALLVNQSLQLRDFRQATAFAEAGLRTAGPYLSPALRSDLYVMQAKAFAAMKARTDARRCITIAEHAAGRIRRENEPPETGYMQPGLVESQLAEALTSLGELARAREYAQAAVRTEAHARGRVHRVATLATVDLSGGEVEQAAASAEHMVDLATGMESFRIRDRFSKLRSDFVRTGNAAALDAAARIDQMLSVPL